MSFLLRRAGHGLLLLLGVSVLCFALLQLAPGNFLDEMRLNPQISPQTITTLRAHYGMDQPLPVRYARWIESALRGDLGYSFAYNTPVAPLLLSRARNTILLAALATLVAWAIALVLGIYAARLRKWPDALFSAGTATLVSLPDVLIAIVLLLFAVKTHALPVGGMSSADSESFSAGEKFRDTLRHLALPLTALVLSLLPMLLRHVRSAMREALDSPFVNAARAHGISRQRVLWRHALPAAANPLISLFGISLATMLSASLLIEIIMSWPGLGPLLLEAILARDFYLVIGAVMFSSLLLLAGNFVSDMMLLAIDPRIRRS